MCFFSFGVDLVVVVGVAGVWEERRRVSRDICPVKDSIMVFKDSNIICIKLNNEAKILQSDNLRFISTLVTRQ